jgi:hypothetical protein
MENKVSIKLPEWADNVSCQANKDMVDIEFIPKKEFKDGDILVAERGNLVFILKNIIKNNAYDFYTGFDGTSLIGDGFCHYTYYRYATEEEKQKLFDAMDKEGLKWNAEKKQVENIRWRAYIDCEYFFFTSKMSIERCLELHDGVDTARYEIGNYFKTKEEAEQKAEQIKKILKQK